MSGMLTPDWEACGRGGGRRAEATMAGMQHFERHQPANKASKRYREPRRRGCEKGGSVNALMHSLRPPAGAIKLRLVEVNLRALLLVVPGRR